MTEAKKTKGWLLLAVLVGTLYCLASGAEAAQFFVTQAGAGSEDGTTWGNALKGDQLVTKLKEAASGDVFWVAAGTYKPHATSCDVSFTLKDGVAFYGGFEGTETSLDQRNPAAHVTILTGDLQSNDVFIDGVGYSGTTGVDNSRHVVIASGVSAATILDGFTIRGGNAHGDADQPVSKGGGIYNLGGSPTVRACTFTANYALYGGGMYSNNGSPGVTHCTFSNNVACFTGGGMDHYQGNPTVRGCTFSNNNAQDGGGMYNNDSSLTVQTCTFSGNAATDDGGGIHNINGSPTVQGCTFSGNTATANGGGMRNDGGTATVRGCTFSGNTAQGGGGMSNSTGSSTVANCTFSGNTANANGGGMGVANSHGTVTNCTFSGNIATNGRGVYRSGGSLGVTNCIFWGSGTPGGQIRDIGVPAAVVTYSVTDLAGTGNTQADPVLGALGANGGSTRTCALGSGSSALNSGTSTGAPATDQRGIARPQGSGVDMGAYEAVPTPTAIPQPSPAPVPDPSPAPVPDPFPSPVPPVSPDVPPFACPISPDPRDWAAERGRADASGASSLVLTTAFTSPRPLALLGVEGAGFLPGTVTGELVLEGTGSEGGAHRYLLRVMGRVVQGWLETAALTSLRYRLLEDVAERDVPLPEGGLRVKDMRVSEASPTPLRGGSGGGCDGGFGPLCLFLLPVLGVLRRR